MSQQHSAEEGVKVELENIGGVDHRTLELTHGVNVLAGRNATNRTSTLRAIMAACGGDNAYLKADADRGNVTLTIGDETYTRTFERTNKGVKTGGAPLLTDENRIKAAVYFAFLLADNEARMGVLNPDTNLRDIVMGPVDTDAIEEQIETLQAELQSLEKAIEERETLQNETLPHLEESWTNIQEKIQDLETQLDETGNELEAADEDVETSRDQKEQIDALTSELNEAREEKFRLERLIESEETALDEAHDELEEVRDEIETLDAYDEVDQVTIEDELSNLRDRQEELDKNIDILTTVISFNEERLAGEGTISDAVAAALGDQVDADRSNRSPSEITRQLTEPAPDTTMVRCWTCGQQAEQAQIETTIDALQAEVQDHQTNRSEIRDDITTLEAEINSIEEKQRERQRLRQRASSLETTINDTKDRIGSLEEQLSAASERVEGIENRIGELETDDEAYSRVIDLNSKITELETERKQAKNDLEDIEDEIANVEDRLADLANVENQRAELKEELEQQKQRIDVIRETVVEEFNDNMDTLLEMLKYENIERVWLEHRQKDIRKGRTKVTETIFDLHVVRETEEGSVFEDTQGVEHLSESERAIVGLAFALSGYLAHNVDEDVPFILLDSLEAVDSERISRLVGHFRDRTKYLVVTLLPEDCEPLLTEVEPEAVVHY